MNLATWSIRNPIPAILFFTLMTLAGFWGFKNLAIKNFPDVSAPMVSVSLYLPGAAPAQLETEVARKVENSLASLSGLKHIYTSITDGVVSITVEFVLNKPISDALIETKDAVDEIRGELPSDLEPPTVSAVHISSEPLMTYTLSSTKMDEEKLSWFVDDTIGKTLLSLKGIGQVGRMGGVTREALVEVDPTRLEALNVTASDISHALREMQMESSGGRGQIGGSEQSIRAIATVARAEDLKNISLSLPDGRAIRLDQVANVVDTYKDRSQAAFLNGQAVVAFQILSAKGSDETKVAASVQAALLKLQTKNPDLKFTLVNNTVDYTLDQYHGSMLMLYEGALLAVIVVWFFLKDWRATLISATALPLSIIPTFAIMHWLGYSLNTLTLLAQAVVVGILVDDAIVEIENIVRHKKMGKSVYDAAVEAVNEIALAVIATTFALVVVFLPTSFMPGVAGLFFEQFGWTIVISVLMSLLVARLITPVMAVYFLKEGKYEPEIDSRMMTRYLGWVRICLSYPKITMLLTALFLVFSFMLAGRLPSGFLPASDIGYTMINLKLPPGSSIESSIAAAEKVQRILKNNKNVKDVFAAIGVPVKDSSGSVSVGEVNTATLIVSFIPREQRAKQTIVENQMRAELKNIAGVRMTMGSGSPGEKLSIILTGDNADALMVTSLNLEKSLRKMSGLGNVSSTASLQRPEIIVRPDVRKAADVGVTTSAIASTVRVATSGDFNAALAKINLDNRQIYVRVRFPDKMRTDMNTIAQLRVPTRAGTTTLSTVADIHMSTGPSQINRYDRHRFVVVNADLGGLPLGPALEAAQKSSAIQTMPSSVRMIESGDTEIMEELFSGFGMAMLTGVLCVFCVLVLLFKDFFQPTTILTALPLSFGGSFIALLLTGGQMSLPALIGIVMLMGIVTKNSILLVEYTIVSMRDRGMSRHEAVLDACHKRARPIIMTTIAMIAGMLPIALGYGGDSSFRQPMAVSVIGGLITSTVLSLLVVPVTFSYINRFENWVMHFFPKKGF